MNYRRVNVDGKSHTETRLASAALKPGTMVVINGSGEFAPAADFSQRFYVVNPAYTQGLNIDEDVPAGDSAVADYVEEGREFAVLVGEGSYTKDQDLTMDANGQVIAIPSGAGDYTVFATSQDDATVGASATDFIRVRICEHRTVTVA